MCAHPNTLSTPTELDGGMPPLRPGERAEGGVREASTARFTHLSTERSPMRQPYRKMIISSRLTS